MSSPSEPEPEHRHADASPSRPQPGDAVLRIYEIGPTTVVGFGGADVLDTVNLAHCRQELGDLIQQHNVEVLAFDLTGVVLVPSGLLGLLASLRQTGVEVHIYNPSADVREVLEVTHLDDIMPIREVDVRSEATDAS